MTNVVRPFEFMNAKIDIKTPAGRSLEGFPKTVSCNEHEPILADVLDMFAFYPKVGNPTLHPGDTITIEIL